MALQEWLVGLIVAIALAMVLWRFMPTRWRQALARRLGVRASAGGGCHACDDCGACAEPSADLNKNRL